MTIQDIRDIAPCYDPGKYLPEDWEGSVVDILNIAGCPANDRLWVVLREEFIDAKTLRLFAVWCFHEALKLVDKPDPRSIGACDVAERYANGEATADEMAAAGDAARVAARCVARAAGADAGAAAGVAAGVVAGALCGPGARDVAWVAAGAAAGGGENGVAQIEQLKSMIGK